MVLLSLSQKIRHQLLLEPGLPAALQVQVGGYVLTVVQGPWLLPGVKVQEAGLRGPPLKEEAQNLLKVQHLLLSCSPQSPSVSFVSSAWWVRTGSLPGWNRLVLQTQPYQPRNIPSKWYEPTYPTNNLKNQVSVSQGLCTSQPLLSLRIMSAIITIGDYAKVVSLSKLLSQQHICVRPHFATCGTKWVARLTEILLSQDTKRGL